MSSGDTNLQRAAAETLLVLSKMVPGQRASGMNQKGWEKSIEHLLRYFTDNKRMLEEMHVSQEDLATFQVRLPATAIRSATQSHDYAARAHRPSGPDDGPDERK